MSFFSVFASDLKREFSGYGRSSLQKDVMAGVTTGAVALPLALAFGVSSGADASAGLIAAIASAFIIGALSGASFQISGPTGAMAAILVPLSARYGLLAVFAAGALSGVVLIVIGLLKLGKIVNLLPAAVISGFTSGIALLIALGQLDNLLGVRTEGEDVISKIVFLFRNRPAINLYSLAIGAAVTVFVAIWPKRFNKKVPGSLLGVALATFAEFAFKFPIDTVGEIPKTLIGERRLDLTRFISDPGLLNIVLLPGISIAALCLIESLLCGVVGGRMKGEPLNADRELIAQGVGNLVLPFIGGVPSTAAIARTSVAIRAGGRTRLTGMIHGVFLLASMFLFGSFISLVPLSALAGVLIVTSWRMNEWESIKYLFSRRFKGAMAKFIITLAATVVFDLTVAIAAGCVLAIALFIARMTNLDVTVSGYDPSRMEGDLDLPLKTEVAYITGPLFFGCVDKLRKGLDGTSGDLVILSMRGAPSVDVSATQCIHEFCADMVKNGRHVAFSCLNDSVRAMFDRGGVTEIVGENAYFSSSNAAIKAWACAACADADAR